MSRLNCGYTLTNTDPGACLGGTALLFRFTVYGLLGWALEIAWTGLGSLLPPTDWRLVGRTYLWMFPIYGGGALLLEGLVPAIAPLHWLVRGAIWTTVIFGLEYATGYVLRALTGQCPWDYCRARFSVNGLIRLDYAPAWFALGLAFEQITTVVHAAEPQLRQVVLMLLLR